MRSKIKMITPCPNPRAWRRLCTAYQAIELAQSALECAIATDAYFIDLEFWRIAYMPHPYEGSWWDNRKRRKKTCG